MLARRKGGYGSAVWYCAPGGRRDVHETTPTRTGSPARLEGRLAMSVHRRRLSAILHADLTGFVRLMEGAEDRTVNHLKSVQDEIWRPAIETGGGSVVNVVGDSVLAEFESAMASVATAIDIQERMARFNDMLDEDRRLMFRIGLHLGEVIVDEKTQAIFGDGVNIAARIQAMAEPGGIAVSRALRDVTELQVEHVFVDGGEHRAKNVSRALQIYHVRPREGAPSRSTTSMVPERTLRFQGADRKGRKYGFSMNGQADRPARRRDRRDVDHATSCYRIRPCRDAMRGCSWRAACCRSKIWARPTAPRWTARRRFRESAGRCRLAPRSRSAKSRLRWGASDVRRLDPTAGRGRR